MRSFWSALQSHKSDTSIYGTIISKQADPGVQVGTNVIAINSKSGPLRNFTIMLASHVYHAIATVKDEDPIFPLLLAHAVVESLRVILAALAFLLHPNILKRAFCKKPAAKFTATELMNCRVLCCAIKHEKK